MRDLLMRADVRSHAEPTILTVAGKIETTNRGPLDPFRDAFLSHKDVKFEKAFAFTPQRWPRCR